MRFAGRGPKEPSDRRAILRELKPAAPPVAELRQIHSAEVVLGDLPGRWGEGDALVTRESDLALSIVTADCVPVLLAGAKGLAAVHAGWRGIVAGVVPRALDALEGPIRAWIGPAIGPCCYEVDDQVARKVLAVSSDEISTPVPGGKPHLDLVRAVEFQLVAGGRVSEEAVTRTGGCTLCDPERLWSFRGQGGEAERNLAYIWKR